MSTSSHEYEYKAYRDEIVMILQQRYVLFGSLVALYALSASLVSNPGNPAVKVLASRYPVLLLAITLPILIMNYYLSRHFHRIDTFVRTLENLEPHQHSWQRTYSEFRVLQGRSIPRWLPKPLVESAYTIPLLLSYALVVGFGAAISLFFNSLPLLVGVFIGTSYFLLVFSWWSLDGFSRWKGVRGKFEAWWKFSFEWAATRDVAGPKVIVFLDRDGVLNRNLETGVLSVEEFKIVKDFQDSMRFLTRPHFRLVVVTNQPYISEGKLSAEELEKMNKELTNRFLSSIDETLPLETLSSIKSAGYLSVRVCPHAANGDCDCRKPKIGMFHEAVKPLQLSNLSSFYVVGDQKTDYDAAANLRSSFVGVKVRMVLVTSSAGLGKRSESELAKGGKKPDYVARNLSDAAIWISGQERLGEYARSLPSNGTRR